MPKNMKRYLITVHDRENDQTWSYEAGGILAAPYVVADQGEQFMMVLRNLNAGELAMAIGCMLDSAVHVAGPEIVAEIAAAAGKARIDESRIMHYGRRR